jgi:hypothetical protein
MALPPHAYAHTLSPALAPASETPASIAARLERVPQRFLSALSIAFRSAKGRAGFAEDLRWCAGLCRATWCDEATWSGLVHVQRGPKKRTHLMYAALRGDATRVRWLLERGASAALSHTGYAPLTWAAERGHLEVVRILLAAGANVRAETVCGVRRGWTALHSASSSGDVEVVRALLAAGADVTVAYSLNLYTALHFAAVAGSVDIVCELLAAGADAALEDVDGCTARQILTEEHPARVWPGPGAIGARAGGAAR